MCWVSCFCIQMYEASCFDCSTCTWNAYVCVYTHLHLHVHICTLYSTLTLVL